MPGTYLNPESIRPKTDMMTNPGLAGIYEARDRERYESAASLQDLMQVMEGKKVQEELIMGAPVRAAERTAKIEQAPIETRQKGANLETTLLTNAETRGTQAGKIAATNRTNLGKISDADFQEMQRGIAVASAIGQMRGPHAMMQIKDYLQQNKVDMNSPVVKAILQGNPQEIAGRAKKVFDALSQASQEHRTKMDEQGLRNQGGVDTANTTGWWSLEAAKERAAAQRKDALYRFSTGDDNNKLSIGAFLLANEDLDPKLRAAIEAGMKQARQNLAAKAQGTNPFQIPLPPSQPNPNNWDPNQQRRPTKRWNPQTKQMEPINY